MIRYRANLGGMVENPFSPRHPINPKYFINREEILANLEKSLKTTAESEIPKPDNIALLGRWGIGKTSTLRKFCDSAVNDTGVKTFISHIELTPVSCRDVKSFLIKTLEDMEKNSLSELSLYGHIRKELSEWRRVSENYAINPTEDNNLFSRFEDALKDLWFGILKPFGINAAVLMFDNLHYLVKGNEGVFYDIKSMFQRLSFDGCNYMLLITGCENLLDNGDLSEIQRFFDRYRLGLFNLSETRDAILKPVELSGLDVTLDDSVIERVYDLTRGYPYFIHFIMRDLIDLKRAGRITEDFLDECWPKISGHLRREKFEDEVRSVSPSERKILFQMAKLPHNEIAPAQIGVNGKGTLLKRLETRGLLLKPERGVYSIYHPLFKEYLRIR